MRRSNFINMFGLGFAIVLTFVSSVFTPFIIAYLCLAYFESVLLFYVLYWVCGIGHLVLVGWLSYKLNVAVKKYLGVRKNG